MVTQAPPLRFAQPTPQLTTPTLAHDDLGPRRTLLLNEPRVGLEAFVVVDNVACGPAIGGVRMAPDVSVAEVARLARAMTLKNAVAGLPHGGGKSGIVADPATPPKRKEALIRAFSRLISDISDYIPGPDMGTDEHCMAWIRDETAHGVVGLPRVLGGIPLDEIGATGFGLAIAAEVAAPAAGFSLEGARVAVQGFGAVGQHVARFLIERGARLVAAADIAGAVYEPNGLDLAALLQHKEQAASVTTFPGGRAISHEAFLGVACEIWIPAARPDVLTEANVAQLNTKLVLQGANIPATAGAEAWLHAHGIVSIPDFVANAGGVICGAVEYAGGTEAQAMATIAEKIRANTTEILARAKREHLAPREAAEQVAQQRLREALSYRRP